MKTLYPPHPKTKIPPHMLPDYEASGAWIAQRKFNGTHVLVNISPDRKVGILTRHGTPPKLFSLTASHIEQILGLNLEPGKEYWLNGELLDHKTKNPHYKGKLVFFDVLQAGKYLFGVKQTDRLALLDDICHNPVYWEPADGIALEVSEDIFLAEPFDECFEIHFEEFLDSDEIEGLVLRKRQSVIDNFGGKPYSVNWLLRCRKPHAGGNYQF